MRINVTLTKEQEEAVFERIGRLNQPEMRITPGQMLHYYINRGIAAYHEDVRAANERDRQLQDETLKRTLGKSK